MPETRRRPAKRARKTDGSLPIYQAAGGEWRLTTAERKRILTTHIYGVDIDPQAVEVTKLSLLLKVLEGESEQTLGSQLRLFQERALPDLARNIKCGNSLIGPEFHDGQQLGLLDDEERYRINAFDWAAEFPEVFTPSPGCRRRTGGEAALRRAQWHGFDAIVGNPPYIRIQTMKEWAPLEVEYYKRAYAAAGKGNYDIYVVFVERALSLLNPRGRLGFILPHKFFNAQYGEPLRELLAGGRHLAEIVHFGDQQVFHPRRPTRACCSWIGPAGTSSASSAWRIWPPGARRGKSTPKVSQTFRVSAASIPADRATAAEWNFTVGAGAALFEKLRAMPVKLGDVADLFVGLQTDADDVFILEEVRQDNDKVLCRSKATEREHWFENDHLKPFLKGSLNIRRYELTDATKRLIFPYETRAGKSVLIDAKDYQQRYPLTWTYLEENQKRLTARNKGQMGHEWHGYVYKKNHTRFHLSKLLVHQLRQGVALQPTSKAATISLAVVGAVEAGMALL